MLKLNASFNKKVPAEQDYSSKGYSASIELEIPDGLSQEQLREKIHSTFEMVRASVESEIDGTADKMATTTVSKPELVRVITPANNAKEPMPNQQRFEPQSSKQPSNDQASPKQVKYLTDIARKLNVSLVGYLQNCGCNEPSQLSRQDCSTLIKNIQNYAAA
ncbi:MAG: hypothetical protein WCR55_12800 [Lentisphaerota bacterium]